MMNKKLLQIFLFLAVFFSASVLSAQIAGWDFDPLTGGSNNFGASPLAPATTDPNVTVGGLTRGSGIGTTGTGAGNAWGGNDLITANAAAAIAGGDFITFTVKPNATYALNISSIDAYNVRRSATGPTTGQWQYQIDAGAFVDIGSPVTFGAITTAAGNPQASIPLSGIAALQGISDLTTVTFRLVIWGGSATTGTWYLNDPSGTPGTDFSISATVLPIELINFSAKAVDSKATLSFSTATERNNAYFSIERSQDGSRFETIGKVTGAGTSLMKQDYTFTDERPLKGTNFYRLKQVDFDGQFSYSPVVSVNIGKVGGVKLSPQPVLDRLTVALEQPTVEAATWQVYDFSGRLLQSGTLESESANFEISTATLTEGSYVLRLVNGQQIITQQFQKN